jgi:hypothetical protein
MVSSEANGESATWRRYNYLGALAGAAGALVVGSLYFASVVSTSLNIFETAARYTLAGLGPVLGGSLLIGVIAIRWLNRAEARPLAAAGAAFGLSIAITILTSSVATAFGVPFGVGLLMFGVPIIWCMSLSGLLLAPLSRHSTLSAVLLAGVAVVGAAGALSL